MRVEVRNEKVVIDGYVNAVGRDSRPMVDRRSGEKFVEQMVPGVFKNSLEKNSDIPILLNHDEKRNLGDTKTNLKLFEDSIGLRAITEITDQEVIEKAKKKKLRGWSFGFVEKKASEEDTSSGMKRRFVEELELKEVSLIDDRKNPCYCGTSVYVRADEEEVIEERASEAEMVYEEVAEERAKDLSEYKNAIKELGGTI